MWNDSTNLFDGREADSIGLKRIMRQQAIHISFLFQKTSKKSCLWWIKGWSLIQMFSDFVIFQKVLKYCRLKLINPWHNQRSILISLTVDKSKYEDSEDTDDRESGDEIVPKGVNYGLRMTTKFSQMHNDGSSIP